MQCAYNILKEGGKLPKELYWELQAEGIDPSIVITLIEFNELKLDDLNFKSEDCLDSPDRLFGHKVLREFKQMGQDEANIHPQAFQICQIIHTI